MHKYIYNGPVFKFDTCFIKNWGGETIASSEKKAKSNLIYQIKKMFNLMPNANINLPGKIIMVD